MNTPNENSPSLKNNKSTPILPFDNNNTSKKKINGSTSFKNLNFIPIEFTGNFQDGQEVKTTREQRKKIFQSASLLHIRQNDQPTALSSRPRDNSPLVPKEINGFSPCDQLKILNEIFPNEIKKNCNKICCDENRSKFLCAICNSEVKFSNSASNSDYVFFGGCFYHINCMKCSSCSTNLQPPFYIEKASKIYCSNCWFNKKKKFS